MFGYVFCDFSISDIQKDSIMEVLNQNEEQLFYLTTNLCATLVINAEN